MKKLISLVVVFVVLLTACSSGTSDNRFVRATIEPESLDIALVTTGVTFEVMVDIYSGIYYVDGEGNLVLDGAESVDKSEDGLAYTVKLKEGLKWVDSSGEEKADVTADDYMFTYERILTPETGAQMSYLFAGVIEGASEMLNGEGGFDQVGIKKVDDYTIEFKLNYQAPYFESMLAFGTFYPQPKGAYEEYGDSYAIDESKMWYNGAYYTTSWDPEYEVALSKNESFWDAENVEVDGVTFRNIPDLDTAKQAFSSGDIDYFGTSDENLYRDGLDGYKAKDNLTAYSNYIGLNLEGEYTSDEDLREALYYGFNREDVTVGFSGEVNKAHEVLIPAGISGVTYDGLEYRDYAKDSYGSYDVDRAKEALQRYMDKNSITDPSEIKLKFLVPEDTTGSKIGASVQAEYKNSLGIDLSVEILPNSQFRDKRKNGEFDLIVSAWGPDYADPSTYMDIFKSANVNSINVPRYQNPEYDKAAEEAAKVIEPEARMEAYAELEEQVLEEDMILIPFYQRNDPYFISDDYEISQHLFFKLSDRNTKYLGE